MFKHTQHALCHVNFKQEDIGVTHTGPPPPTDTSAFSLSLFLSGSLLSEMCCD